MEIDKIGLNDFILPQLDLLSRISPYRLESELKVKMDSITVENFRCFKNRQTARLAPLTILVGENSTGKSSFMAMIGILWHSVILEEFKPSFKNYPFDLGTFSDVIHGNKGQEFSGGFQIGDYKAEIRFKKGNVDPDAYWYRIENSKISITITRFNGRKIA